jgi:hypothetical protein
MAQATETSYSGWPRCLRFTDGQVHLILTLDVGPRVLHCGLGDGPNLFKIFDDQCGVTQGEQWLPFGGHRLWHAPEVYPRTYAPDFDPVEYRWRDSTVTLIQPPERTTGLQKQIALTGDGEGRVTLTHTLINHNLWAIDASPWCITQMAPGGRAIVPQEDYRSHPEHLYPARPLVLWHFTQMDDPRVHWGSRFIQLFEDARVDQKIKFGALNKQRWAAYWVEGYLFVKTFDAMPGVTYPDYNSNCEFFTMPGFLEVESLGPLTRIEPGGRVDHCEIWHVWPLEALPQTESALADVLKPFLDQLAFP